MFTLRLYDSGFRFCGILRVRIKSLGFMTWILGFRPQGVLV